MNTKQEEVRKYLSSLSNEDLLQVFNITKDILDIQTISSYKRKHKMSYNGVRFKKNLRTSIQNIELIIDNGK